MNRRGGGGRSEEEGEGCEVMRSRWRGDALVMRSNGGGAAGVGEDDGDGDSVSSQGRRGGHRLERGEAKSTTVTTRTKVQRG